MFQIRWVFRLPKSDKRGPSSAYGKHIHFPNDRLLQDIKEMPILFKILIFSDSNKEQLAALEEGLAGTTAEWKIVFGHHPPLSVGQRWGDSAVLEEVIENNL